MTFNKFFGRTGKTHVLDFFIEHSNDEYTIKYLQDNCIDFLTTHDVIDELDIYDTVNELSDMNFLSKSRKLDDVYYKINVEHPIVKAVLVYDVELARSG